MGSLINTYSIQESAVKFANSIIGQLNQAVAKTAGVEVMWFRATPDKRSQDVIFQSYTLYGVEDCPLKFNAMYSDTSYDDAAITYNIMGLAYAIPLTLDIAMSTWKEVTENDGTIPQQHDIVYIPISQKLLEVVSMQPVKAIGAQLTSYKVNLEIYKPTRSRIVGENLKESIKESTTNYEERFGDAIDEQIKNIVDDKQLSIYDSTEEDKYKKITPTNSDESAIFDIRSITEYNLTVDGHTVSRSYYDVKSSGETIVRYEAGDKFSSDQQRCYSCWFRRQTPDCMDVIKNIKGGMDYRTDSSFGYLEFSLGSKFKIGEHVTIKRGKMIIPAEVVAINTVRFPKIIGSNLSTITPTWYDLPGFAVTKDNVVNLLNGNDFCISIKSGTYISLYNNGVEQLVMLPNEIKDEYWYGLILNISKNIDVDIFDTENGLKKYTEAHGITNTAMTNYDVANFSLVSSYTNITNIRLYNTANTDIDKQMTDLVTYNVKNDYNTIINDSSDIYLNRPYLGRQR